MSGFACRQLFKADSDGNSRVPSSVIQPSDKLTGRGGHTECTNMANMADTSAQSKTANIERCKDILRAADTICFDVDSTVVSEEGINVLAEYCGVGEEVAAVTKKAMEGGMLFQDALAARLSVMKPSRQQVEACLKAHPLQLTEGVQEFISLCQNQGKHVFLVSGGFRQMIYPLADKLGIARANVTANNLLFDDDGTYKGFDEKEPTSRTGGKPRALEEIKTRINAQTIVMIGDGVTDMEAKPPAKAFIGFGGVKQRAKVKQGADWFVESFAPLLGALSASQQQS